MKNTEATDDDLLPEYDLRNLRVRKFGSGRTSFAGHGVVLAPDVAAVFPDSNAVNEALRFLMRIARDSPALPVAKTSEH